MAQWKRLTYPDGTQADVNLENVAYIHRYGEFSTITFVSGLSDKALAVVVKETPDQIHMAQALRSK